MAGGSRQLFHLGSRLAGLFKRDGSSPTAAAPAPPLPPSPPAQGANLEEARALKQQGRFGEAQTLCRQALAIQPDDIEACLLLAEIYVAQGDRDHAIELYCKVIELRPDQALAYYKRGNLLKDREQFEAALADYDRAITLNPRYAYALCNRGVVLSRLNRLEAALDSYDRAIAISPDDALVLFNRADVLRQLKQPEEALASFDRALSIRPDHLESLFNRGVLLLEQRRLTEALASFDRAVALKPDYVEVHFNLGLLLLEQRRLTEALASFDRAVALKPDFLKAHFHRGLLLIELRRLTEALASFDAALALKPDYLEGHFNRGVLLVELRRLTEALASFDRAAALQPAFPDVHLSRGSLLIELGRFAEALASLDRALALKPGDPDTHLARATAFLRMKSYVEAIPEYGQVVAFKPDLRFALGFLQHCKMQICDWGGLDADIGRLVAGVRNGATVSSTLHVLAVVDDEAVHREAAQIWVREECPAIHDLPALPERAPSGKLRIGYFSGDFHDHPVAVLAAELFESHDRSRFEITAFSLRPNSYSANRRRLEKAFDRFVDVCDRPDHDVALLARRYEIDIAVDLGGHTDSGRPGILARRAAPIQVAYLGYPGTMGAEYIDYLIGDPTVIPPEHRSHYSEKIVYLPHCYLPNDSTRKIGATPTREQENLPPDGFVFCCFNASYKIMPETFSSWMRILARVDSSVLWLSALTDPAAADNLQREAQRLGVDPRRLIFANLAPSSSQHLARLKLADLILDTLPYNAHASSMDALWAGVPVLTRIGRSFAGRVAASVLRSIGLPELVTTSVQQYEGLAVELATNPTLLAEIRQRLANNRLTTPLFDSRSFVRHLESAYTMVFERYRAGLSPDHIYVAKER
jgi:protein O-GlcNAc transferase